jgi:hypothetical protein
MHANASGDPDRTSDAEANLDYGPNAAALPANGANPIAGIWSGYVEAPASDFFNISVDTDAAATVGLDLDGVPITLAQNGTRWHNTEPIQWRAGTLYAITLTVENVHTAVGVRWQTTVSGAQWKTTARGWEIIPGRYLYPSTVRDHLLAGYTRFFKAASLAAALNLSSAELAHLGADVDYQIDGQSWLNALPVTGSASVATAYALTHALRALLDFARLKAAFSRTDERLLGVLEDPPAAAKNGELLALTLWDAASLTALLDRFGIAENDLTHLATLQRVATAFEQTQALGVAAGELIAATTNAPTPDVVRDLQGALRARYATSDWIDVIKPINDDLRALQRDALVAYVLHQMRSNPASAHIDTPDKLFEYFLMDVQMQPCMQTSRIRSALSAAQLFIERCLMNLEPRTAASAINAAQWEWMKRYRVWEANRKVFLWPENWLEPELRDDQSPFFRELMSELLQSDITEDTAAAALGKYLVKLDGVAHLEPCGIHVAEHDPGVTDDVAYVVARTSGSSRAYYWRRRDGGSWTPWEQIKLAIDDNPVIPVLWKNRLFVFWLKIIPQLATAAAPTGLATPDKDLTALRTSEIKTPPPQFTVQAMLCWSEYYNGSWQPAKTSDPNLPTTLTTLGHNAFDRSKLVLSAEIGSETLEIDISGQGSSSFLLYNTHSLPVRAEDQPMTFFFGEGDRRSLVTDKGTLTATYSPGYILGFGLPVPTSLPRPILTNSLPAATVQPTHHVAHPWDAPFFYTDSSHVFYVSTEDRPVSVSKWDGYVVSPKKPPKVTVKIPPLVFEPVFVKPDLLGPVIDGVAKGISDPLPMATFLSQDAYLTKGLGTVGTVPFGGSQLGPAGSVANQNG